MVFSPEARQPVNTLTPEQRSERTRRVRAKDDKTVCRACAPFFGRPAEADPAGGSLPRSPTLRFQAAVKSFW
jgi:hypothetical protein